MTKSIIEIRNIAKRYKLGQIQGYKTIRESLQNIFKHRQEKQDVDYIWALKDVSFDVQEGEVLGIIGPNGAGKTTLLKVLSRITEPTIGEIRLRGRVISLLEVGTGFHPELTGRENIFLNGSILGMKRREIQNKFDEIVSFAEVEKYIDTPVKRYSSGMYVRLAFAVAAHLEPEILMVDEVLSVGDVRFQKKCLGKMSEVSQGGRTVLFVSHNMGAIRQLVSRCILLEKGKVAFDGSKEEAISRYLQFSSSGSEPRRTFPDRSPTEESPIVIKGVALRKGDGNYTTEFSLGGLEVDIEAIKKNIRFYSSIHIHNEFGINVYHLVSWDTDRKFFLSNVHSKLSIFLPKLRLYPGRYTLDVYLGCADGSWKNIDKIWSAISFQVDQSAGLEVSRALGRGLAVVHEVADWRIQKS